MDDWRSVVELHHGESSAANSFVRSVERHISSYKAMKVADSRHPDPKDVFESMQAIREKACELGKEIDDAPVTVPGRIAEGILLRDPHAGQKAAQAIDLAPFLRDVVLGLDELIAEWGKDPDVRRRGYHKNNARNMLVKNVADCYADCFAEEAIAGNPSFAEVLEAILASLGLPRANLHRVLQGSIPS